MISAATSEQDCYYFDEQYVRVTDDSKIYVTAHHPVIDSGVTVFCLSGYRDDQTNIKFVEARDAALAAGASVVAFDYRGHGKSEGPVRNEGLTAYLDDARMAFAYGVPPAHKIIIVGHSMGAHLQFLLARQLDATAPERVAGMVAVAPVHALTARDRLVDKLLARQKFSDQLKKDGILSNPYVRGMAYSREFLDGYEQTNLVENLPSDLPMPTEFIASKGDIFLSMDDVYAVAGSMPKATVLECGKDHGMQDPESLAAITSAITRQVRSATRVRAGRLVHN